MTEQNEIDVGQVDPGDQVLLDLNGLPLTDLPGILSVISRSIGWGCSVVKGVCISDAIRCPTLRFPAVS